LKDIYEVLFEIKFSLLSARIVVDGMQRNCARMEEAMADLIPIFNSAFFFLAAMSKTTRARHSPFQRMVSSYRPCQRRVKSEQSGRLGQTDLFVAGYREA
jgi:hypothetical protein